MGVGDRKLFHTIKKVIGEPWFGDLLSDERDHYWKQYCALYEGMKEGDRVVVPRPGAINWGKGRSWHMTEIPNPCLHCDSLNPGEKLQCTQCGAPLHPMYAVS